MIAARSRRCGPQRPTGDFGKMQLQPHSLPLQRNEKLTKTKLLPLLSRGGAKVTALSNTYPAMKSPKLLTLAGIAAFITSASASVTIDWVNVGNAGNAADSTSYGAVSYAYQIGKYEVTNAQYGAFLNAAAKTDSYGLYNSSMSSYGITRSGSSGSYTYSVTTALANRPVVYVSWFDAARMANWMMNGQGSGSTETGTYTLNGAISGIVLANAGAQVYIPTENEWYKAAYYSPNYGGTGVGGYWTYATQSDTVPTAVTAGEAAMCASNASKASTPSSTIAISNISLPNPASPAWAARKPARPAMTS